MQCHLYGEAFWKESLLSVLSHSFQDKRTLCFLCNLLSVCNVTGFVSLLLKKGGGGEQVTGNTRKELTCFMDIPQH